MCKELATGGIHAARCMMILLQIHTSPPAGCSACAACFRSVLMSARAVVCLIRIIHGICILPDTANELWKCVVFCVYTERSVFSSCRIPCWNMSGSARPVIGAQRSVSERCLRECGNESGKKKIQTDFWSLSSWLARADDDFTDNMNSRV